MILDFTMLGTTVPEPNKDPTDRHFYVCSAGWSPDHGLVRLYPWYLGEDIPRKWSRVRVKVERHPYDHRPETWRPVGQYVMGEDLSRTKKAKYCSEVLSSLEEYIVPGIDAANSDRKSLTLVRPSDWLFKLHRNDDAECEPSYGLYDRSGRALKSAERFAHKPRLHFWTPERIAAGWKGKTADARPHQLQFRDWGIFELMRREADKISAMSPEDQNQYVGGRLVKYMREGESLLLLGNYAQYRGTWLIVSELHQIKP